MRSDLKISVVIPLYQKATHIKRCLNSIQASLDLAGNAHEIIVVDDGSTDDSTEIALNWLKSKSNTLKGSWKFHSGPNRGVSAARNTGWRMARNEIIMFIDADDQWDRLYVHNMTNLIYNNPNASLYGVGREKNPILSAPEFSVTWKSCLNEIGGFSEGVSDRESLGWSRLGSLSYAVNQRGEFI